MRRHNRTWFPNQECLRRCQDESRVKGVSVEETSDSKTREVELLETYDVWSQEQNRLTTTEDREGNIQDNISINRVMNRVMNDQCSLQSITETAKEGVDAWLGNWCRTNHMQQILLVTSLLLSLPFPCKIPCFWCSPDWYNSNSYDSYW